MLYTRKEPYMSIVEPIKDKNALKKIEQELLESNYRNYALFCLGINSGLRISDILKLKSKNIQEV